MDKNVHACVHAHAAALSDLAHNNSDTQMAIAKAGAIPPLVQMLEHADAGTQEHATCAIWHLAANSDNQIAIAKASGIAPLVKLLVEGSAAL